MTSLDGISGSLIQTSLSGVSDQRRRLKFRLGKRSIGKKINKMDKPFHSQDCLKSKFKTNTKFHFIYYFKNIIAPCESAADKVSFEWSHRRISFTDSKVRITLMSLHLTLGVKGLTLNLRPVLGICGRIFSFRPKNWNPKKKIHTRYTYQSHIIMHTKINIQFFCYWMGWASLVWS